MVTRRDFLKGGVATFTLGFVAPSLLTEMAEAAAPADKNLVVIYLGGGNDGLSTLIPYNDPFYYSRRPTISLVKDTVLQLGTDSGGAAIGLHPRLTGIHNVYKAGNAALFQRVGYPGSSRSHFTGTDIWSTAEMSGNAPFGWLGKYLETLPTPQDPLFAWNTSGATPRLLVSPTQQVPAIPTIGGYGYAGTSEAEGRIERQFQQAISSHVPVNRPHVAFVNDVTKSALQSVDRVQSVSTYAPSVAYPNTGFGSALRMVAGAITKQVGTKIFYVVTGGYDTHAAENPRNGAYFNLMATLNDGIDAFYKDMVNQGKINDVLIAQFSEFGRRIDENSSGGTDHGAGSVMMILGGSVKGGLYGTAPDLKPDPANPTLESNGGDVRYGVDFRGVYARIADDWLKTDSVQLLGGNFRDDRMAFL